MTFGLPPATAIEPRSAPVARSAQTRPHRAALRASWAAKSTSNAVSGGSGRQALLRMPPNPFSFIRRGFVPGLSYQR